LFPNLRAASAFTGFRPGLLAAAGQGAIRAVPHGSAPGDAAKNKMTSSRTSTAASGPAGPNASGGVGTSGRTSTSTSGLAGSAASGLASSAAAAAAESAAHGMRIGGTASLASRPVPGPSVHNPHPAENLRVLGAATLPPGSEPDPTGAVSVSPAAAPRPGGPAARGLLGGYSAAPVQERASPRERWEAAVAARPLEAPRSLPAALHAMASAITGRARPPLFTTGPATRNALAAAGALGATTGTVVHLPAVPAPAPAMSAVLAHELMHTRSPVRRPRFLLDGVSGLLDDDERQALAAGKQRLSAAGADVGQGLLDRGRQAGQGLLESGRQRLTEAAPAAAGIVDQLPVGGGLGAVGDVATRAAKAAVLEAASGPLGAAQGWANGAQSAAAGALDSAGGMASNALSTASGAAAGVLDSATQAASGFAGQAASAVSGVAQTAGGLASAAKNALDPDTIVEIVESRLLREIERRGGRWAGMF
jgi:hypothetical protein